MQSVIDTNPLRDEEIKKISQWIAIAAILQVSESLIPHPFPGIRLGLANMVALIVLANYGFSAALSVNLARTVLSSFMLGTFMSPAFILSFFSALSSMLVMGLLYTVSIRDNRVYFSLIGISVAGAFVHNITQLGFAYVLLIRHPGVFVLLPWLSIGGVVMGIITGIIGLNVTGRLRNPIGGRVYIYYSAGTELPFEIKNYLPGNSFIHRLKPEIKILAIILLAPAVLVVKDPLFCMAALAGIVMITALSGISLLKILTGVKKVFFLILASFLLPVFFNSGGETVLNAGSFVITQEGLSAGALFGLRIIVLVMFASLLMRTASAVELTMGFEKVLAPLRIFGVDHYRISRIISMSWQWIPELWKETRGMMRFMLSGREKGIKKRISALTDFIVYLFQS